MLIVTIAALLMAASLAWFAYRLMQEEHRRSDARVAVLAAALESEAPAFAPFAQPAARAWAPAVRHGSINGTTPAAVRPTPTPDIVMLEDDTRNMRAFRSEHDGPAPRAVDRADVLRAPVAEAPPSDVTDSVRTRESGLFAEVPAARRSDARGLVAVIAIVLVAGLAAAYALFGRTPEAGAVAPTATSQPAAAAVTPAARPAGIPLELVSMSHTQQRGALVVTGRVRNPAAGSDLSRVVAHVAVLDAAGVVVGQVDAPVASATVPAGREVAFEARVKTDPTVRRYRVTFNDGRGNQIVHVDRRQS